MCKVMRPCKVGGYVKKLHSAALRMRMCLLKREKFYQNGFERAWRQEAAYLPAPIRECRLVLNACLPQMAELSTGAHRTALGRGLAFLARMAVQCFCGAGSALVIRNQHAIAIMFIAATRPK